MAKVMFGPAVKVMPCSGSQALSEVMLEVGCQVSALVAPFRASLLTWSASQNEASLLQPVEHHFCYGARPRSCPEPWENEASLAGKSDAKK